MNAIPLFTKDGKATNVSYCSVCLLPKPHDLAEICCKKGVCEKCGGETGTAHNKVCYDCREKDRMDKAEKLETWDGPVVYNDHYHETLDDLLDCHDAEELPEFIYVAEVAPFPKIDIEDFLQGYCEDLFEDAEEHLDGVNELAAAFKAFNEANAGNTYWLESNKRAVRVPKKESTPCP